MEKLEKTSADQIEIAVQEAKFNLAKLLRDLGLTATEFTEDYLDELTTAGFLKSEGAAIAAHDKAVTEQQIELVGNAVRRSQNSLITIDTYIDQYGILSITINPIIN